MAQSKRIPKQNQTAFPIGISLAKKLLLDLFKIFQETGFLLLVLNEKNYSQGFDVAI